MCTMRHSLIILLLVLLTQPAWCAEPARPNIIVILADDLGYSDLGCYGGEIRTPNIDALASQGLRFTQFYNGGRCCPTRASLMTGLHPHQAGVGRMTMDAGAPGYRGTLTENTVTIAEALRTSGYRTGMVGKWHLSPTREGPGHLKALSNQVVLDTFSDPKTYPVARGFERHYGVIWGVVNYFDPFSLVRNTEPVPQVPDDYYITDALTNEAVQYIQQWSNSPDPFFLYVAHVAPHWPLHALVPDVTRYAETYTAGWDTIREARHRRMLERSLLPANQKTLSPRHEPQRQWADNPSKEWDARAMAVHAAMIDRMDQGIGRIVSELRERKLLDNTLILFLSDNGASPEAYPDPGFDRPAQTRDGRKITYPPNKQTPAGTETTFFGIGPMWANVANTPFRRWKAEMYEGGICTPLVAHWPAGLKTRPGALTHQPGHVIDIIATCLDAAGATYPQEFDGHRITPMQGKSLLPIFQGNQRPGHDVLAWEHFGHRAIRRGNLKLVSRPRGEWELYDLAQDRSELTNLATDRPQDVRDLAQRWEQWAKSHRVYPLPPG